MPVPQFRIISQMLDSPGRSDSDENIVHDEEYVEVEEVTHLNNQRARRGPDRELAENGGSHARSWKRCMTARSTASPKNEVAKRVEGRESGESGGLKDQRPVTGPVLSSREVSVSSISESGPHSAHSSESGTSQAGHQSSHPSEDGASLEAAGWTRRRWHDALIQSRLLSPGVRSEVALRRREIQVIKFLSQSLHPAA